MPIIDFDKKYQNDLKRILNQDNITSKNKEYLQEFLKSYEVSPSRKCLFLNHIRLLLPYSKDLKQEMQNKQIINDIFYKIRNTYNLGYYETVKAVSNRFVRWLNDGEKPIGFKDIKCSKKGQKRDLSPSDMITWEEGLKMASCTNSIQMKAMILTQLDGGFRPGELYDLNFGDVTRDRQYMVIHVKSGKTGSRDVILYRSVPYLSPWLDTHPTKDPNSPLWIIEDAKDGLHRKTVTDKNRYTYRAIAERFKRIGEKAGIKKPVDLYNFRHSACTISKNDNSPTDLASEKFGHSEKYYSETYGRLSIDDRKNRFAKLYGLNEKDKQTDNNLTCGYCQTPNPPKKEVCVKCNMPLTVKKAMEDKKEIEDIKKENQELKENMIRLQQQIEELKPFMEGWKEVYKDIKTRELITKASKP